MNRWSYFALLLLAFANSGCGDPAASDAGIAVTVKRPAGLVINEVQVTVFENGRLILTTNKPDIPNSDPLPETFILNLIVHGAPNGAGVTVVARGLQNDAEQDSSSAQVSLETGSFVSTTVDMETGTPCAANEDCNGTDANCNDVVDDGCCPAGTWEYETVALSGESPTLRLVDGDQPRIAFTKSANLAYAKRVNGSWVLQEFETPESDGDFPVLAFDSSERAHILSFKTPQSKIIHHYQTKKDGGFSSRVWEDVDNIAVLQSLDIDTSTDEMHLGYLLNDKEYYQSSSVNQSVPDSVEEVDSSSYFQALAVPKTGQVHAVEFSDPNAVSFFTHPGNWFFAGGTVGLPGTVFGASAAMEGESEIGVLISTADGSMQKLWYARHIDSAPTPDITPLYSGDTDVLYSLHPTLDIDNFGSAHILYATNHVVEYMCRKSDNTWTSAENIHINANAFHQRAIAFGSDQCVHAVYQVAGGAIEYARRCPN